LDWPGRGAFANFFFYGLCLSAPPYEKTEYRDSPFFFFFFPFFLSKEKIRREAGGNAPLFFLTFLCVFPPFRHLRPGGRTKLANLFFFFPLLFFSSSRRHCIARVSSSTARPFPPPRHNLLFWPEEFFSSFGRRFFPSPFPEGLSFFFFYRPRITHGAIHWPSFPLSPPSFPLIVPHFTSCFPCPPETGR